MELRAKGIANVVVVADEIYIECGQYVFTENDLLPVLREGWRRQRVGEKPLSRRHWLGRSPFWGDEDKYNAFCDSLVSVGALAGRRARASGRLVKPPLSTISELRYKASGETGRTGG